VDKEGNPTDYEFIEVNKAFERFVTSNEVTMIGKSRRDIIPDNTKNPFDWISFYGEVALSGKAASIEQYSEALDRWYSVEVYSQEKGYFATIFIDITSFKKKELELIDKNKQLGQLYEEIAATQEELRETGKLRGFEALLRWNSPEMGFLNPMEFIPIAEETGLIIQIGEWVLNTACRTCKKFETIYGCDLVMAVNISPIQLRQKNFHKMVIKALKATGLKSRSLELEVTEGIFIDSYDSIFDKLRVLKELGVKMALDDFGTGYSSLSYLKRLPITLLKIDKSFVREIDFLNLDNELTESIIALVSKLNINTIAEGVETLEQLNYLVSAKCDYLQGYFLGKPDPEDLIGGIIERGCLKKFLDPPLRNNI